MEGLFYHQDYNGITFLYFDRSGRVVAFIKSDRFIQPLKKYTWVKVEAETTYFSQGFYQIEKGTEIRIVIKGDYGKLVYHGIIENQDTIHLTNKCPFTNYIKSAPYLRLSVENKIGYKKLIDICVN